MAVRIEDLDSNFKEIEREDGTLDTVTEDELDGVHLYRNQDNIISKQETPERVKKFFDYFNLRVALPWLQALTKKVNGLLTAIGEKVWAEDVENATWIAKNYADEKAKAIEERIDELPTVDDVTAAKEAAIADADGKLAGKANIYISLEERFTDGDANAETTLGLDGYKMILPKTDGTVTITNNTDNWVEIRYDVDGMDMGDSFGFNPKETKVFRNGVANSAEVTFGFASSTPSWGFDFTVNIKNDVRDACLLAEKANGAVGDLAEKVTLLPTMDDVEAAKAAAIADADGKLDGKANVFFDEQRIVITPSVCNIDFGMEYSYITFVASCDGDGFDFESNAPDLYASVEVNGVHQLYAGPNSNEVIHVEMNFSAGDEIKLTFGVAGTTYDYVYATITIQGGKVDLNDAYLLVKENAQKLQNTEDWVFTLEDGTEVTKRVVLG